MDYTYDLAGNLLTVTDRLSHATTYAYDHLHRRTSSTDANSGVTAFTYDAVGNLLSLSDPELNVTSWQYDALNRVVKETNELDADRLFAYDNASNLTQKTDRLGRVTQYAYDHLHRLTAELWKNGGSTVRTLAYSYDALARLLNTNDPSAEYDFEYDPYGRVTKVTADLAGLSSDVELTNVFDAVGNRTSLSAKIGSTKDFINTYRYDDLYRLTQVTQEDQVGGNTVADKRVDFAYNVASQWETITRYQSLNTSELVATTTYGYDDAGRLASILHENAATTDLAGYDYTYDAADRITEIDSLIDGLLAYDYDDTNQLTDADHTGQVDEAYSYDDNGNRIGGEYETAANNRTIEDADFTYAYDAEGNLVLQTNKTTGETIEYTWDYRNRLTDITFRNASQVITKSVTQAYDTFNRWIQSTYDSNGSTAGGVSERFFIYDGTQIVLEFDDTSAADVSHRYLWGPAVDQIFADEQVTSVGTAGDILWPLTDHLGTTRDLLTYNTGTDTTTLANHRRFDSFGNMVSQTNGGFVIFFGFTGRPFDVNSGLQNNWRRWYISHLGVWASEDPIGFPGDASNLNRYVLNGPTNLTDPDGLQPAAGTAGSWGGAWGGSAGWSWGGNAPATRPVRPQAGAAGATARPGAAAGTASAAGSIARIGNAAAGPMNAVQMHSIHRDMTLARSIQRMVDAGDMSLAEGKDVFRRLSALPAFPHTNGRWFTNWEIYHCDMLPADEFLPFDINGSKLAQRVQAELAILRAEIASAAKLRLAKELGGIPRSAQPIHQGVYSRPGTDRQTRWWEYLDSNGNRKIVVQHDDGSVHVGTPKPQSQHLDGSGPPKYYPEPGTGHVGDD